MPNPTGKGGFAEREENPGRPKGTSFADLIRKVGAEQYGEGVTKSEAVVRNAFNIALDPTHNATIQAMKWIADRAEGTPQQSIDVTTKGESINTGELTHEERVRRLAALLGWEGTGGNRPSSTG